MLFPVFVNHVIFVKLVFPAKIDAQVVKMEPTLIQPLKGVILVRMVITETQLLGLVNVKKKKKKKKRKNNFYFQKSI
jgi:predicted small integral membrane protein